MERKRESERARVPLPSQNLDSVTTPLGQMALEMAKPKKTYSCVSAGGHSLFPNRELAIRLSCEVLKFGCGVKFVYIY